MISNTILEHVFSFNGAQVIETLEDSTNEFVTDKFINAYRICDQLVTVTSALWLLQNHLQTKLEKTSDR